MHRKVLKLTLFQIKLKMMDFVFSMDTMINLVEKLIQEKAGCKKGHQPYKAQG